MPNSHSPKDGEGEQRVSDRLAFNEKGLPVTEEPHAPDPPGARRRRITLSSNNRKLLIVGGAVAVALVFALVMWAGKERANPNGQKPVAENGHAASEENEVELSPEALAAAGIEIVAVSEQSGITMLRVTGAVEPNQQQTQQVTPLVSGRVERVNVVLGDRVRAGAVLAIVSSPEVAEMHGKLHEAETRLALAEQSYARVQRAENRVSMIQANARLDEAEATLRRTRRLIELGAGAGKDLIAAEAAHKSAKAEYDYQSNISINREVQHARSEVETSRVEVSHLRNSLGALGADLSEVSQGKASHDTSVVALRAPVSGKVTERSVNAGAGIEAGKPIFTISNISTLWVIANVPEGQVNALSVGTPATVRIAALGEESIAGRVTYIDTALNEETRTGRVRVEIANRGERLKIGMFVEVGFETGRNGPEAAAGAALVIPDEAVQRIGDRSIVFVPKNGEPGHFEVRDVELGGTAERFVRILSGLELGDRVVAKGSFTLKTQLMKSEMGEHGH